MLVKSFRCSYEKTYLYIAALVTVIQERIETVATSCVQFEYYSRLVRSFARFAFVALSIAYLLVPTYLFVCLCNFEVCLIEKKKNKKK